ncbi:FkbM family methyltransferase [Sulfurimonas sp.]
MRLTANMCFNNSFIKFFLDKSNLNILDVGAAGGVEPVFMQLEDLEGINILGFEPLDANFNKLHSSSNIGYHKLALSNFDGTAVFYTHGTQSTLEEEVASSNLKKARYSYEKQDVDVKKIKTIINEGLISHVDVLKIDVEGAELKVIKGCDNELDNILFIKSEFGMDNGDSGLFDIDNYLKVNNFVMFRIAYNESIMNSIQSGDVLYVKDIFAIVDNDKYSKEEKKIKIVKLIGLSLLYNLDIYAKTSLNVANNSNIFDELEYLELEKIVNEYTYVPALFSPWGSIRYKIGKVFLVMAQLLLGDLKEESMFKPNELISRRFFNIKTKYIPKKYLQKYNKQTNKMIEEVVASKNINIFGW